MNETITLENRKKKSDIFYGINYEKFLKIMEEYGYQKAGYEKKIISCHEEILFHPEKGVIFYAYFNEGLEKVQICFEVTHPSKDDMSKEQIDAYKKAFNSILSLGCHFCDKKGKWHLQVDAKFFKQEIDNVLSEIDEICNVLTPSIPWTKSLLFKEGRPVFLSPTEEHFFSDDCDAFEKIKKCNNSAKKIMNI